MRKLLKNIAKKVMVCVQTISPELATKILYKRYFGKKLNMKNPETLNEKMQWLKLRYYRNSPIVRQCVDKYEVRKYIENIGRSDLLVDLIGVWDNPEDIDYNKLPDKFVLKCNHGSGSVIVCRDKKTLNIEDTKEKLILWLKEDFGRERAELSYKGVKKKIVCEKLIETTDGKTPKDYKIFCNYGVPKFLFVASERNGENAYFDYYDLEWNHYPVKNSHPNSPYIVEKPQNFNEMLKAASDLSNGFPLVRVDLYNENGKIYFGELTFLHFGGLHPFEPDIFDKKFGDMIDISKEIKKK